MPGIDQNTILMLHFDDSVTDSSQYEHSITEDGAGFTPDSKFGIAAAGNFGASKRFSLVRSDDLQLGISNFTIDFWVKFTVGNVGYQCLIDGRATRDTVGWVITVAPDNTLHAYFGGGASWDVDMNAGSIAGLVGSYSHIAVVREGSQFYFFIDGVQKATATSGVDISDAEQNISIGCGGWVTAGLTSAHYLHGNMDELRISNVARWTSDFTPPSEPYSPEYDIIIERPRTGGIVTYARQFVYNKLGQFSTVLAGAIVSGMPVAGQPASALPVGTKIALTDPAKLSPNEVGYIVVQQNEDTAYLTTDAHQVTGTWTNRDTTAQQFITDMTEAAKAVCALVKGAMTATQIGHHGYQETGEVLAYFQSDVTTKRVFWSDWWTDSRSTTNTSHQPLYCRSSGSISDTSISSANTTHALRPLLSIPSSTLVSSQPNAAGAYELV